MSTSRCSIEIGDAARQRFESVAARVDTGTSYLLIPRSIIENLGHSPTHRRRFGLADGGVIDLGLSQVPVRIGQETAVVSCVFGEEESESSLGATALEEFGLGVDPVNHTLIPVVLNLLGFEAEDHDH